MTGTDARARRVLLRSGWPAISAPEHGVDILGMSRRVVFRRCAPALAVAAVTALTACGPPQEPFEPTGDRTRKTVEGSVTGGGLAGLFGSGEDGAATGGGGAGSGIGVNSYLWRASLDTISFMPVASADPFGGVIITDWYSPSDSPEERFKVNLYILGRELRANGLRASVFRQVRKNGEWVDAEVTGETATQLENAILSRAREMRVAGR